MVAGKPRKPKALKQLEELDDRLELVQLWAEKEVGRTYSYRSQALNQAQYVENLTKRSKAQHTICENHARRIEEIENTVEAFEDAYHACRKTLDNNAILAYAVKILPDVRKEMEANIKRRQDEQMGKAEKKAKKIKAREEKKTSDMQTKLDAHMKAKAEAEAKAKLKEKNIQEKGVDKK